MKKLSVVIVSYNARQYLGPCIRSVEQAMKGIDGEIIVVDNQSSDGTVEDLKTHFPQVQVVESGGNIGFAKANNIGIRLSHSPYVLLLNPDTVVGAFRRNMAKAPLITSISAGSDHDSQLM